MNRARRGVVVSGSQSFTPREIVSELDRYIVGQAKAKRAVAIALRNRFRRQRVPAELRDEIAPKNIIMIGPYGRGKDRDCAKLAKLSQAPFVKVEATKFTEVGYVGRDVESMIRDLVEHAIELVRSEQKDTVKTRAEQQAEDSSCSLIARPQAASKQEEPPQPQRLWPLQLRLACRAKQESEPFDRGVRAFRHAQQVAGRASSKSAWSRSTWTSHGGSPLVSLFGGPGMEDIERKMGDMFRAACGRQGPQ